MALDKVMIGERIRKVREKTLHESRSTFGKRCGFSDRYIGQLERGEFLLSLPTVDKIASATGVDTDYFLYGKGGDDKTKIRHALHTIIDRSSSLQLDMFYNCAHTILFYEAIKEKEKKQEIEKKKQER